MNNFVVFFGLYYYCLPLHQQILNTLLEQLMSEEESITGSSAGCLGSLCSHLEADQVAELVRDHMMGN